MRTEKRSFTVDVIFRAFDPGERVVFVETRATHLVPGINPGQVYVVKSCEPPCSVEEDDSFVFLEGEGRPFTTAFLGSELRPASDATLTTGFQIDPHIGEVFSLDESHPIAQHMKSSIFGIAVASTTQEPQSPVAVRLPDIEGVKLGYLTPSEEGAV